MARQTRTVMAAAAIDRAGRLNIAWANDDGPWIGPVPVGGPVLDPWSGVALAKQGDEILTAAAIGKDGTLHVAWVEGTGQWQAPVPVGGPWIHPRSGVAMGHQPDGVLVAGMISPNGQLHMAWVVGTGTWQAPVPVGGTGLEPQSRIAMARQGDEILTAVMIGADGTLHVAWVNETGNWQGPVPVGGPVLEPNAGIALAPQTAGTLTAVSVGKDGRLHVAWVDDTGAWQGPVAVGDPVLEPWSGVGLAKQGGDILSAVAVGADGHLHVAWVNEIGEWFGPIPIGPQVLEPSGSVVAANQTPDVLTAMAMGGNGILHVAWVTKTGQWTGPVPTSGASRRICQLTGNYDPEGLAHRNDSTTAQIAGTDLGFPVEFRDQLVLLFGDQFDGSFQRDLDPIGITTARAVDPDGFALDYLREPLGSNRFRPIRVNGITHPLGFFETPTGGFAAEDEHGIERLWAFINAVAPGDRDDSQILLCSTTSLDEDFDLHYQVAYMDRETPTVPVERSKHNRLFLSTGVVVDNARWPGLPSSEGKGLLIIGSGFDPIDSDQRIQAYLGWVQLPLKPVRTTDQGTAPQLDIQYYRAPPAGGDAWTREPGEATGLFPVRAISFISLSWVADLERWVAMSTECWPKNQPVGARDFGANPGFERPIVIRSAPTPWGPWSDRLPILHPYEAYGRYLHNPSGGPQPLRFDPIDESIDGWLYSPTILDRFTTSSDGTTSLHWLLSTGTPYHVQLMRTDLRRRPD